jgi:hypothetical protein
VRRGNLRLDSATVAQRRVILLGTLILQVFQYQRQKKLKKMSRGETHLATESKSQFACIDPGVQENLKEKMMQQQ